MQNFRFKSIWIALLMIINVSFVVAQGIEFEHDKPFEELLNQAATENKLIFMDCYTTWCGPCKRLAATVFVLDDVGNFHNRNFINTKFDMEKGEGVDIASRYGIRAYPTLLWINGKGEVVHKVVGGLDGSGLIENGKKALGQTGSNDAFQKMKAEYDGGKRDIDFLAGYITELNNNGANTDKVFSEYLAAMPTTISKESKHIKNILTFTNDLSSPAIPYIVKNKSLFQSAVGSDAFTKKVNDWVKNAVNKSVKEKNSVTFNQAINFLKNIGGKDVAQLQNKYSMEYYDKIGDFANYKKTAVPFIKKYGSKDDKTLNKIAWNYYINSDNPADLKKALNWSKQAIAIKDNTENQTTYAYLNYKLGNSKEAIKACDYALLKGNEDGANVKSAEALKALLAKEEEKLKKEIQNK